MSLRPQHPIQFLAALIAAFLLWYALAAERIENISVRNLKAPLTLANIPRDLVVVTSSVPDTVSLQLRGPLTRALDSGSPPQHQEMVEQVGRLVRHALRLGHGGKRRLDCLFSHLLRHSPEPGLEQGRGVAAVWTPAVAIRDHLAELGEHRPEVQAPGL